MRAITWTPTSIAIGERVDGQALALVITDYGEESTIPMSRASAHRIGSELVAAAALTPDELTDLEELDRLAREHSEQLH
jgi:hypothetical protein